MPKDILWYNPECTNDNCNHGSDYIRPPSSGQQKEAIVRSRPKRKLLDRVRDAIRLKQYSPRTGTAYVHWIKRFILFHDKRHPKDMGATEIEAFLTYLAVDQHVAPSTQNQALSALCFSSTTRFSICR